MIPSLDLGAGAVASPAARADAALDSLLARLDPWQSVMVDALVSVTGNVQSLAGAGSGKTTTTVAAVGALLRAGAAPASIVATTFTSKAGKELHERLSAVIAPGPLAALRVGTFHGLALRSIKAASPAVAERFAMPRCMDIDGRAEGIPGSRLLWMKVLGWSDVPGLDRKGLDLDLEALGISSGDYALACDVIRSRGVDNGDREASAEALATGLPHFREAWDLYEAAKGTLGAWDFADALSVWCRALRSDACRDSAGIVIVDEAQDNSAIQLDIAKLLARGGRLVLVGDVRQAIYSWRGAAPAIFAGAHEALNASRVELPANYRSGSAIVDVGNAIADGKTWCVGAPSVARRPLVGTVGILATAADPFAEAKEVAHRIGRDLQAGERADAFAVLVRTNAMSGPYEAAFVRARIPVIVVGGTPFFKRKEVLDVMAYAALIQHDSIAQIDRIANRPKRYLGRAFVDALRAAHDGGDVVATIQRVAPTLRGGSARGAAQLAADITRIRAVGWPSADDRAEGDLRGLGIVVSMLAPEDRDGAADDDVRGMYASAAGIAATFPNAADFVAFAIACGATVETIGEQGDIARASTGRVTISTIHKAKGLEWTHLTVSASAGVFPHRRSVEAAARGEAERMHEEERLFYVACTRARDTLTIAASALNLYGKPAGVSPFTQAWVAPFRTDIPPGGPPGSGGSRAPRAQEAAGDAGPMVGSSGTSARQIAAQCGSAEAEASGCANAVDRRGASRSGGTAPAGAEHGAGATASAEPVDDSVPASARAIAETRTAAEPRAAAGGGEGSRFVEVSAASVAELLGAAGFVEGVASGQRVWDASAGPSRCIVRVYSTIAPGDDVARGVGEDSIRIVALYRRPGEAERPVLPKEAWVCRTRGWRVALLDRIEGAIVALDAVPPCPYCGAPTRERKAADGGIFRGCLRWKECRAERDAQRGGR